jgi:hypothetical protein
MKKAKKYPGIGPVTQEHIDAEKAEREMMGTVLRSGATVAQALDAHGFTSVVDHGGGTEKYVTGAVREATTGRGRFDLIPPYPIKRLACHYEAGAKKYLDRNWEKGIKLARFIDSTERHINSFKDGDRTEDHLAAALWNLCGYLHTEREIAEGRLPAELSNVPWEPSMVYENKP